MSNDYILKDIPWDDEEKMVDREPASDGSKKHFGNLQLFALEVTKSWTAGDYVTIAGVNGGQFNEKDNAGLMKFKGWKAGGNRVLYVFVATKKDKDGNNYQIVKQYKSKVDKAGEPHLWGDYVYPAIRALDPSGRSQLTKGGPFEWEESPTGNFAEIEGQKQEVKAWTGFKVHTAESLKAAEDAFFAQFSGNGAAPSEDSYPTQWKGFVPDMLAEVAKLLQSDKPIAEVIAATFLVANGEPATTIAGGKADVKSILMQAYGAIDAPEPLKVSVLDKINSL